VKHFSSSAQPDDALVRWQLEEIRRGIEEADRGEFATDEEVRQAVALDESSALNESVVEPYLSITHLSSAILSFSTSPSRQNPCQTSDLTNR
jgi:hypothetical protein